MNRVRLVTIVYAMTDLLPPRCTNEGFTASFLDLRHHVEHPLMFTSATDVVFSLTLPQNNL